MRDEILAGDQMTCLELFLNSTAVRPPKHTIAISERIKKVLNDKRELDMHEEGLVGNNSDLNDSTEFFRCVPMSARSSVSRMSLISRKT